MKKLIVLFVFAVTLCSFSIGSNPDGKIKGAVLSSQNSIAGFLQNLHNSYVPDCLGGCFEAFDTCISNNGVGSGGFGQCFTDLRSCISQCPV